MRLIHLIDWHEFYALTILFIARQAVVVSIKMIVSMQIHTENSNNYAQSTSEHVFLRSSVAQINVMTLKYSAYSGWAE